MGVGAHPRLLPHAVAEVHSFVSRVYAFVRLLFPALPEERAVHVIPNGIITSQTNFCKAVGITCLLCYF